MHVLRLACALAVWLYGWMCGGVFWVGGGSSVCCAEVHILCCLSGAQCICTSTPVALKLEESSCQPFTGVADTPARKSEGDQVLGVAQVYLSGRDERRLCYVCQGVEGGACASCV